jgi:thiol-disulfide isomerase/thioredoxin
VILAGRLAAVLASVALLAGCSASAERPAARPKSPFAGCSALTSAPSPQPAPSVRAASSARATAPAGSVAPADAVASPDANAGAGGSGTLLPQLSLPCFTGDQKVDVGQIKGPALINLWASWCLPCREELPVFQRLAGRAEGRLHVIGVVSSDDRDAAQSLAEDLGISFPALYDRQGALLPRLGRGGLPVTVFVGAAGRISYVHNSAPLDDAALARLVSQHLGLVPA